MDKNRRVIIAGAGPAGASLAIRLAQGNFRVTLIERDKFPRQKLCGEFISPECFRHFRALGVFDEMLGSGGDRIAQTIFYAMNGKSVSVASDWFDANEAGALSLSRAEMDSVLLEHARKFGVEVSEETSVTGLLTEGNVVRGVKTKSANSVITELTADLMIDATGRANVLTKMAGKFTDSEFRIPNSESRKIQNPKSKIQNRLVGFKTHLKNVNLEKGRCEIYFFRGGYGGLSYVENELANFCFLMKAEQVKEFNSDVGKIIENLVFENERAFETLRNYEAVHEWLAVSVDSFGRKNLSPAQNLLTVGDAAAFIDPFTGSGMLMALECAEILARTIIENADFSERIGEIYRNAHQAKFQKRLRVCALLRRAAFSPKLAQTAIAALHWSRSARILLARATRQTLAANKNG